MPPRRSSPLQTQINSVTNARMGRGASASLAVSFEMREFEKSLEAYLRTFPQSIVRVVKTLAFDLERAIKKRTPVDTGRLRASFHTVAPGQTDSFTYEAKDAKGVASSFDGRLKESPVDPSTGVVEAIVGTNVTYASIIESGTSRQAPQGMVRVSIAELRGRLERAVAQAAASPSPLTTVPGIRDVESPFIF